MSIVYDIVVLFCYVFIYVPDTYYFALDSWRTAFVKKRGLGFGGDAVFFFRTYFTSAQSPPKRLAHGGVIFVWRELLFVGDASLQDSIAYCLSNTHRP